MQIRAVLQWQIYNFKFSNINILLSVLGSRTTTGFFKDSFDTAFNPYNKMDCESSFEYGSKIHYLLAHIIL